MKALIACEYSGIVREAFKAKGWDAWSCDLDDTDIPGQHIKGDVLGILSDGWDLLIGFPPCTYMSRAGARWMYPTSGNLCQDRYAKAMQAKGMFLELLNAPVEFIAVENPTPLKVVELPKYSQVIQPYEYGHEYSKRTLLWLKNLPLLKPTDIKSNYKPYLPSNTGGKKRGQAYQFVNITQKERSKTFQGIADAMADQWTKFIMGESPENSKP